MNDFLHIRTVFFVISIIGLILFLCMVYILRTRKTFSGFGFWTAASILYFLGNILLGFRNILPDLISIIFANLIVIITAFCILYGLSLFADNRHAIWPYATVFVTLTLILFYFTYAMPNVRMRIIMLSVTLTICSIYSLVIIYKDIPPSFKSSNMLLEVSLIGAGACNFFRALYTLLFEKRMLDFLSSSSVQSISIIIFSGLFLSLVFGLIILNFQRVESDLFHSKNEIRELEAIIPMCASCKKIRDDSGFWEQVESYIQSHSDAKLTHAICPECMNKLYPDYPE